MPRDEQQPREAEHRTLRSLGLTLLGVVLSISTTAAFGSPGPWWMRVGVGVATAFALLLVIKVSTDQGAQGPVVRLADWITGGGRSS
jgi:hypothetical protein